MKKRAYSIVIALGLFGALFFSSIRATARSSQGDDSELKAMAKERARVAATQVQWMERAVKNPILVTNPGAPKAPISVEMLYIWSRRLMTAEQELAENKEGSVAAIQKHLDRLKRWEDVFARRIASRASSATQQDLDSLTYFDLEARTELLKIKGAK